MLAYTAATPSSPQAKTLRWNSPAPLRPAGQTTGTYSSGTNTPSRILSWLWVARMPSTSPGPPVRRPVQVGGEAGPVEVHVHAEGGGRGHGGQPPLEIEDLRQAQLGPTEVFRNGDAQVAGRL